VLARTATKLKRFPLQGAPSELPFDRVIAGGLVPDGGSRRFALLSSTNRRPYEVTAYDPAAGATTVVTDLNPQVASWMTGTTQVVRWKDAEGVAIEGVLTLAPDAKAGSPAPLVVMPHGGPDAVSNADFSALVQ
jgi:dipeptidyl aminopeptidase/acylaminoacyl peptidase